MTIETLLYILIGANVAQFAFIYWLIAFMNNNVGNCVNQVWHKVDSEAGRIVQAVHDRPMPVCNHPRVDGAESRY